MELSSFIEKEGSCEELSFFIEQVRKYSKKQKNLKKRIFVSILKVTDEKTRIRIRNQVYGSKDPDPYQNATDPEHCIIRIFSK